MSTFWSLSGRLLAGSKGKTRHFWPGPGQKGVPEHDRIVSLRRRSSSPNKTESVSAKRVKNPQNPARKRPTERAKRAPWDSGGPTRRFRTEPAKAGSFPPRKTQEKPAFAGSCFPLGAVRVFSAKPAGRVKKASKYNIVQEPSDPLVGS